VADEDDGAVRLLDDSFEIGDVGGDAAQGKRSSEQRVLAAVETVEDAAPARGVSERTVTRTMVGLDMRIPFVFETR